MALSARKLKEPAAYPPPVLLFCFLGIVWDPHASLANLLRRTSGMRIWGGGGGIFTLKRLGSQTVGPYSTGKIPVFSWSGYQASGLGSQMSNWEEKKKDLSHRASATHPQNSLSSGATLTGKARSDERQTGNPKCGSTADADRRGIGSSGPKPLPYRCRANMAARGTNPGGALPPVQARQSLGFSAWARVSWPGAS